MSSPEIAPTPPVARPFMQKPVALLDTAFNLFGFLPHDDDSRWHLLSKYNQVKKATNFQPINFANAWGATYLSDTPSFRSGYVTTLNPENCVQLDRALDNLSQIPLVTEAFEQTQNGMGTDVRLTLTDRLTNTGGEPHAATPCPEALYQVRLYYGQYLARVGFNVHDEDGASILSIVNVQGARDGSELIERFSKAFGTSPFNLLVRRVLAMAGSKAKPYTTRGLINPVQGNSRLYWGVLNHEGVELYHAHRKPVPVISPS